MIAPRMLALVAVSALLAARCAAVEDFAGWAADLETFRTELPARHCALFQRLPRAEFDRQVKTLEADLADAPDRTAFLRLERITAAIGDDHTTVIAPPGATIARYPFEIGWFRDGFYLLAVPPDRSAALGARVSAIAGVPIDKVVQRLAPYVSVASDGVVKHRLPKRLNEVALLQLAHLADAEGRVALTAVGPDGTSLELRFDPPTDLDIVRGGARVTVARMRPSLTLADPTRYFFVERLDGGKTLYAQYNRCWGRELEAERGHGAEAAAGLPSIYGFFDEITAAAQAGDVDRLIFDLRWNGGGASDPGTAFVKRIAAVRAINRRGHLFVLVGRQTFSSAILNASDFKQNTEAIFVGEPTGGTPTHFGEVQTFRLPNTEITVNYSTSHFDRGPAGSLVPDVEAWQTFDEYVRGIDPAIAAIRRCGDAPK